MPDGLVFYYRNGCHLCEDMAATLVRRWPRRFEAMSWCDVDSNAQWRSDFGHEVPVLALDGRVISRLLPDWGQLARILGPDEGA